VDGNGRWARIATTAFLFDCGFPVGSIVRKKDKPTYIAALNRAMENHEPGDLANHLLSGYIYAMQRRFGKKLADD
jgi:Fic family protein